MKTRLQKILTKDFLKKEYIVNKKSSIQIAKATGCYDTTVLSYLRKFLIKIRTMSEAKKGQCKGENHYNYNPERHKIYKCIDCNRKILYETATKGKNRCPICYGKFNKGKNCAAYIDGRRYKKYFCIEPCCNNMISYKTARVGKGRCNSCGRKGKLNGNFGKNFLGKNNPNWIDGRSYLPYTIEFNIKLKGQIRKRDNFTCQKCGIKQENHYRKLDVHHIDYDKENCKEENLITLCHDCNLRVNANRDYWENYFKQKCDL